MRGKLIFKFVQSIPLDKLKPLIYSLVMAVILFMALATGISAGVKSAQSRAIITSAANLEAGFNYFYGDQNRFPTAVEFSDQTTMANYFNNFPPVNFAASCSENYIYKRTSDNNFELDFCLPVSVGSYKSGWNVISGQK